ncbi:MAG: hypothetical protein AAFO94_02385 [Bacteroidota bacterium]
MDPLIIMWLGFILAAYSVVGNDVIQTLGTFLSSNEDKPWYILWLFAGSIMTATLVYGWYQYGGDVSYQRLIGDAEDGFNLDNPKYVDPREIDSFGWVYVLPPLVLMIITRVGIPVSTSFLILTFFKPKGLYDMVVKSMSGYLVAFGAAIVLYLFITKSLEKRFANTEMSAQNRRNWTIAQWASTGFLWTQWLAQDFANIYVYLPRRVDGTTLAISLGVLLAMLAYIFYARGGAIQGIVKAKSNTADIRSATFIDLSFGIILYFFKELNNVPMSTTWVFLGLLAGREIAIRYNLDNKVSKETMRDLGLDLAKVFFGLFISIALVFLIKFITGA